MSDQQNWINDPEQVKLFEKRAAEGGMNRRTFLKILAAASATSLAAACGPAATPAPAQPTTAPAAVAQPTAAAPAPTAPPAVAPPTAAPTAVPPAVQPTTPAGPKAGDPVPDAEQIMFEAINEEPASMDFNANLYCAGLTDLWAGLMTFDFDYKAVPVLAQSVDVKGNVWTFKLRTDIKWTNGDPVTAKDFDWSWRRQLHPATAAPYAALLYDIKGAEAFNQKKDLKGTQDELDKADVGIKAVDNTTFEVTLNGPRGFFGAIVAYIAALPNHRGTIEKTGEVFKDGVKASEPNVITTNGPFKLIKWDHQKSLQMDRWDGWAGRKPKLKTVRYAIIPDAQQLQSYEKSEIDRSIVPPAEINRVKNDAKMKNEVISYSASGAFYLVPNPNAKPFDVKGVRRAINHAIDREAIVKSVLQGVGKAALTFDPPDLPHYVDPAKYPKIVELTKFDPKLALEDLKGTPYEGGKNWPAIKLSYRTNEERIGSTQAVQAIQAMLKDNLGMAVELEPLEARVFRANMWDHKQQFTWVRWYSDYPDSNNNLYQVWYSGAGASGHRHDFANQAFDKLVTEAKELASNEERTKKYAEAEIVGLEEGYATYVYYLYQSRVYKPWIGGLPKNSRGEYVQDVNIFFDMHQYMQIVEAQGRPKRSI